MPLAQVTSQRQRESELRAALRQVRTAIDKFKDAVDQRTDRADGAVSRAAKGIRPTSRRWSKACRFRTTSPGAKLKFLRRIPIDPMTNSTEWGLRAYQDKPGLDDVGTRQRVRRLLEELAATALDGTKYKDW